jgi:hypothetical protein
MCGFKKYFKAQPLGTEEGIKKNGRPLIFRFSLQTIAGSLGIQSKAG